jgi:hypothetical protein
MIVHSKIYHWRGIFIELISEHEYCVGLNPRVYVTSRALQDELLKQHGLVQRRRDNLYVGA